MKTQKIIVVKIKVGDITGETEKAYKVDLPLVRSDGEEKTVTAWMPKSRSLKINDACWVTLKEAWLIDAKYREAASSIWHAPIGCEAELEDGSIEYVL